MCEINTNWGGLVLFDFNKKLLSIFSHNTKTQLAPEVAENDTK